MSTTTHTFGELQRSTVGPLHRRCYSRRCSCGFIVLTSSIEGNRNTVAWHLAQQAVQA